MRRHCKQILGAAIVCSMAFSGAVHAAATLLNGNFEVGTGGANASAGDVAAPVGNTTYPWQSYSTYFAPFSGYYTSATARTGTQSMKTFGSPNCGIFQQVDVTPGTSYTALGYIENLSTDALTGGVNQTEDIRLQFYDAVGTPINGAVISPLVVNGLTPTNVWTPLTVTAIAPVGAAYVDIRAFMNNPSFYGGALYVDDVSFAPTISTPEPTSVALLSLAGLGAFRRRRV